MKPKSEPKSDIELLHFVLDQITKLEGYIKGRGEEAFVKDDMLYDACVMKIMVIGEYSSKLSKEFKASHQEIEWPLIKAARNFYVHDYGDLTPARVWKTIIEDIPILKGQMEKIVRDKEEETNNAIN